jgi:hypothetical protein
MYILWDEDREWVLTFEGRQELEGYLEEVFSGNSDEDFAKLQIAHVDRSYKPTRDYKVSLHLNKDNQKA